MQARSLVFTDIVDSTSMVERLGDAAAAALWAEHDRRARLLIERHGGSEIDRSDGFFVLFDRAPNAAAFALAYHATLGELQLNARAGIHHAEVTLRANPPASVARGAKPIEVEGLAKPLAARVMSLARGGHTLLTAGARQALGDVPSGCEIASLGHYRAKGVTEPFELFGLAVTGGALEPPADSDKVHRVVRDGELWLPLREVPHNLAPERDAFVGRTVELRALARRFDSGVRQLTLLGVGGTGKTRLARRYARAWLGDWPGGVYFCDLSEARSLDGIHFAVAAALSIALTRGDPAMQIGHVIAARGRCLVVLDNFEQVVAHAAATVGCWMDRAAQASFIVTSRERLQLHGESVYTLEPMDPATEAAELFVVRAKAQRAAFEPDAQQRLEVIAIARLLDGLPLAVELAAARVRVMSPAQIRQRLSQRFALLGGARGTAARQATLRAAIDWSWDLLQPREQAALAQCSVFDGGFSLEAAEAVVDTSAFVDAPPVMDVVQSLVDKSLLRAWHSGDDAQVDIAEPCFGMFLSIHEYAAQKLVDAGAEASGRARRAHGAYYAGFGSDLAIDALHRHGGTDRRRQMAREIDNIVTACRRAISAGDAAVAWRTAEAAWALLELTGPLSLANDLLARVVEIDPAPPEVRAAARVTRAFAARSIGDVETAARTLDGLLHADPPALDGRYTGRAWALWSDLLAQRGQVDEARHALERALALQRDGRDALGEATTWLELGRLEDEQGRNTEALGAYQKALDMYVGLGDRAATGAVMANISNTLRLLGRIDEALEHYQRTLEIHREAGDRRHEAQALSNLALLQHHRGAIDEAQVAYARALQALRQIGHRQGEAILLNNQGVLLRDLGRIDDARAHYEQALALSRELGDRRREGLVLGNIGVILYAQRRVEPAAVHFAQALALHRAMGNRYGEGDVLDAIGTMLLASARILEARAHFDAALAVHRGVCNSRGEGTTLGNLGRLLALQGDVEAARGAFHEALEVLRRTHHPLELGLVLCQAGRLEGAQGRWPDARRALDEAQRIGLELRVEPKSELQLEIDALRAFVEAGPGGTP